MAPTKQEEDWTFTPERALDALSVMCAYLWHF